MPLEVSGAMRVLMLGWEFPPFISGGLGTACYGLTRALSAQDVKVLFVLPRPADSQWVGHVKILSPSSVIRAEPASSNGGGAGTGGGGGGGVGGGWRVEGGADVGGGGGAERREGVVAEGFENVEFRAVMAGARSPYHQSSGAGAVGETRYSNPGALTTGLPEAGGRSGERGGDEGGGGGGGGGGGESNDYDGDVIGQAEAYKRHCLEMAAHEDFDVIHAHDWMTYPAGLEIARQTGKPLLIHVHSTEFDRSGEQVHSQIYEIERRGMHGADRVLCVSSLTKNLCVHRYGLPEEKAEVVYNGIESNGTSQPRTTIKKDDKIVLFLGRITMQKGPEYFVAAARKVLEKIDNVKFVMAGSGDQVKLVTDLAQRMGVDHKFLFTGFLRGKDVEKVFDMADVYVMPSVSEPFGIAPLEAINHDVPVIISKSSGVSEVLAHALKVDFWDIDEMANKIVAVLRHPPLSQTLREQADLEVRGLTWAGAATRCAQAYERALAGAVEEVE
jgi:glycosyltransferase involved in cell wall biosynthesis